jgi:hypothetical protein
VCNSKSTARSAKEVIVQRWRAMLATAQRRMRSLAALPRWIVGLVLWYFLEPFASSLCSSYTMELVDRDELDTEISYVRRQIRGVERDVEQLQGEDE